MGELEENQGGNPMEEEIDEAVGDGEEMAGRPPRNNRNPHGANQNENPPSPPRVNLSQEDMMAIDTIVLTTLQGTAFDGNSNPEVSHSWLKNVETQLHLLEIPEELRVEVVTQFLEDWACKWWETVSTSLAEIEQITWKICRREFLKKYYPAEFRLQKLNGYENERRNRHQAREEGRNNKKTFISQSAQRGPKFKRPNHSSAPSKGNFNNVVNKEGKWFHNCRKNHVEECYIETGVCFKCGKLGHWIKEYPENKVKGTGPKKPNENKTNARVYAITQEEVDNTNDVVAGMVLLNELPAYALFGRGANHSFVSKRFAQKLKLEHETLSEPLRVATPDSKTIKTHMVYQNYWLDKHHAMVDCQNTYVKLQTPNKKEIIYHGKSNVRKFLLFASQTWIAIKCSEEIYLAMISKVREEAALKLEDIPVVQKFPDVFPEDMSCAILNREVEFEINLVSGAAPISKAPYRMASLELKDLKDQLQELLNKKQIRPSVCGALSS
ncbi:uncharacterized protein [Primulina eburnea]|uniref:uncharacterized protein n=1 Tax=Primulina eburnea TaxID=1245227 RepID=UPI003C6CB9E6